MKQRHSFIETSNGILTVSLFVDLAFEGALWPDGPGLRPLSGASIDEEVAKKIGRFLGVDTLLLVGKSYDEDAQWLWGASFSVVEGTTARRGAVKIGDVSVPAVADKLASFLGNGDTSSGVEHRPLPPSVLPEKSLSLAGSSSSSPSLSVNQRQVVEEVPWIPIAATAGGVVALAALTGGVIFLVESTAKNTTAIVSARSIDSTGATK